MKPNFTRRDFLKGSLLGLGAAFLAACKKAIGVTETAVAPIETGIEPVETQPPVVTEPPAATEPPTVEPVETPPTDTPTELPCFTLLTPEDGAQLPAIGKVTFSWEPMPGATNYQLQITLPTNQVVPFDVDTTTYVRYLESFPMGGTFTWQVAALDEDSAVICVTDFLPSIKRNSGRTRTMTGMVVMAEKFQPTHRRQPRDL